MKIFTGETVEIERGPVVRRTLHSFLVVVVAVSWPLLRDSFVELSDLSVSIMWPSIVLYLNISLLVEY